MINICLSLTLLSFILNILKEDFATTNMNQGNLSTSRVGEFGLGVPERSSESEAEGGEEEEAGEASLAGFPTSTTTSTTTDFT